MKELTAYLYKEIPITKAMGITVSFIDSNTVSLTSPLSPNINHKDTAFGGSLSSLAILSCWTLIHYKLDEITKNYNLVVQKSQINYHAPVNGEFTSTCKLEDEKDWIRFKDSLLKFGKARITLQSEIWSNKRLSCTHTGVYVAIGEKNKVAGK